MDKNKIKSFAIWARRNLIVQVSEKANRIGIYEDKIEEAIVVQGGFKLEEKEEIFSFSNSDREALKNQVKEKGFEQVMEEVAYTWFNRFMGLRYMEVNDYLPTGVRILSSEVEEKKEPDVLTKVSEIIDELGLNANEIYDLLDTGNTIDREKAYRIILVKQCNELGKIIPQMFEKISDYTELLLPDNLLEEGSVIRKMVEDIEESDWLEEVEIIGWMYQYYISEKKDEVFAALKKNVKITKENIPAATQLFTPKWIVKYMVENSLGRLWLEKLSVDSAQWGVVSEELKSKWKYYLEEAEQEPGVEEELKKIREEHSLLSPEDIKVLDPCMGSGHILVYAFDVLYEIYKSAGYSEREIPRMILQNNLYGLDIDDRAAQLASFALIMKARHYNRRLFREIEREHLELNLCSIQESNSIHKEAIDYFCSLETGLDNDELDSDLEYLWSTFIDAKEYGSILEVEKVNFGALKQRLKEIEEDDDLRFGDYRKMLLDRVPMMIKQAEIMSTNYEVCVTNPPYMGQKGINLKLKKYIDDQYEEVKSDIFSVYVKRNIKFTCENGNLGFMTPFVWMFINSYENMREIVTKDNSLLSLIHMEYSAFEEATVPICAYIVKKSKIFNKGVYVDLSSFKGGMKIQEKNFVDAINSKSSDNIYTTNSKNFYNIPNKPIAYWINKRMIEVFEKYESISNLAEPRQGMATSDNDRFLRCWFEVCNSRIGFGYIDSEEALRSNSKWFPYNKGGAFRRWYGNNSYVVNWQNDGFEVKEYAAKLYKSYTRTIKNIPYYFREGLTWSALSSSKASMRYCSNGFLFDTKGQMCFFKDRNIMKYSLALFNSNVTESILKILAPTLDFNSGSIGKIPLVIEPKKISDIDTLVDDNILISKKDWDSFETSWDFKIHPLLLVNSGECIVDSNEEKRNTTHYPLPTIHYISDAFEAWQTECEENFNQLKSNEEELNRIFIDIYGLQEELTPEVEDKDITIRKADRTRDIKSFISYAVGCRFGRYSIDSEGLIYAGRSLVSSEQCLVSSETCKENTLTSFDEIMAKIVDEVKKNESVKLSTINSLAEVNGFSGKNICGDANNDCPAFKLCKYGRNQCNIETDRRNCKDDVCTNEQTSHCPLSTVHYLPDKDNIIPITEDEYFEDDIVSRFIDFVRTVYGNENIEENLDFIADSIGRKVSETARQAIRRYFIKDFYKDHLKVYQKRPIYWMFESGKNDGFKALIYMHRYDEQTVAKVRTEYLHTLQRKYESEVNRLQLVVDSEEYTAKDRTAAKKKIARISKQLEECKEYDQVVAHLANEKISIDLDDGVKVNYAKFQGVTVINSKEKEVKMNLLAKI